MVETLVRMSEKVDEIRNEVLINNETDNDLVDAYNKGVDQMTAQIKQYLNELALVHAFGGGR